MHIGNVDAGASQSHRSPAASHARSQRAVAVWLLICAALVFFMVVLGGLTRLTHSGLSIVEWKPITGVLPPLSQSEWEDAFQKYQQFPEYRKLNQGMTLDGFKGIFWLEFLHRLLGRTIGLVFFIPLVYFVSSRKVTGPLVARLLGIFVLGGLQGLLGWYMVTSGLVDRPDVSQYRLTSHLALAVAIYGLQVWTAYSLLVPHSTAPVGAALRRCAYVLLALIVTTILAGGFVAGLDAGFAYNTFPLMAGRWVPDGLLHLEPWYLNLFDNVATVQFNHRVLAILTGLSGIAFWACTRKRAAVRRTRMVVNGFLLALLAQIALGIATLVWIVPLPIAVAHQAGALVLFTFSLLLVFECRGTRAG